METSSQIKHERDVEPDARMEEESGHSETESEESNSSSSDYDISPERVRKYVNVCFCHGLPLEVWLFRSRMQSSCRLTGSPGCGHRG